MSNQDNVWPRPKKEEDDARVGKTLPDERYRPDPNRITDRKDGKNPDDQLG